MTSTCFVCREKTTQEYKLVWNCDGEPTEANTHVCRKCIKLRDELEKMDADALDKLPKDQKEEPIK